MAYCHKKQSVRNKVCSCGADLVKLKRNQKVKYWISYRLPGGKQRREAVGYSIEEARDAEGKRRSQKRENRIFDIKPDTKMTFNELTEWYLGLEKVKALASYWVIKLSLKKFNSVFGDTIVGNIKPADLENYQAKRKLQGIADGTIDHEIGKAKTMVFKAFDNNMVSGDTLRAFKKIKKLVKRNADARTRVLSSEEFERLLQYSPPHLKAILSTAYYTGMRRGEILGLTWDKIDLKKRLIHLNASDTKDREARTIPICEKLYEVLRTIPRAIHDPHVFLFKGRPVKDIRTALRKACKQAGIEYGRFAKSGFVFHDLRHTFNTNMRKAGVPESVIMKITGHSTREMFDRYNTIDQEDTRKAVGRLETFLASVDQNVDQDQKTEN
ncbi:MAG: site-specific integrase [Deltaproteobacteria bacterium]|nr:site-specific integrase [Deltaproteobacteria bacterium]